MRFPIMAAAAAMQVMAASGFARGTPRVLPRGARDSSVPIIPPAPARSSGAERQRAAACMQAAEAKRLRRRERNLRLVIAGGIGQA